METATETKQEWLIKRLQDLKHMWRVAPAFEVKQINMFDESCIIVEFKDSPIMHAIETYEADVKYHQLNKGYDLAKIITKKNKALVLIPKKPEKSPATN